MVLVTIKIFYDKFQNGYYILLFSVPGPPADIKSMSSGARSVSVTWLPPTQPNGDLLHYSVYYRPLSSLQVIPSLSVNIKSKYKLLE